MKATKILWILLLVVLSAKLTAQNKKRQLTEADYKLWSTMNVEQLSEGGNWVSYSLHYESNADTLFVKHTKRHKTFTFPGGSNGRFVKDGFFICQDSEGELLIQNLSKGTLKVITDVSHYTIAKDGKQLIFQRTVEGKSDMVIRNLENTTEVVTSNVDSYSYSTEANSVVYSMGSTLHITDLSSNVKRVIATGSKAGSFSDFAWQKNGESVAYFYNDSVVSIGFYKIKEQKNYIFDSKSFGDFPRNNTIYNSSSTPLTISDDGGKVFFGTKPADVIEENNGVQIWNTADKSLYPEKRNLKNWTTLPKLAVWVVDTNTFRFITNNEFPHLMLTGDQQNALLYNPIGNEPQFDRDAPIDFYLSDIKTGTKQLLLAKQSPDFNKLTVSATGKFVAYYKDKDWWIYDITAHEHQNLTSIIGVRFDDENYNRSGERKIAGIAGWTTDDEALLVYDTYDVWLVKTDGSGYKRLTDGRSEHISYRIVPESDVNQSHSNFSWNQKGTFPLAEGLLLKSVSDTKNGYYRWTEKNGIQEIVLSSNRIGPIQFSKNKEIFIYSDEHYHQAPRLLWQFKSSKPSLIYQSNIQQKQYEWGFSKLIRFENPKGELLKGALFYPAGYSPEKAYPMVVHIYEQQAAQYNAYVNPSEYNYDGFNISNFTSQGYFVLLPDIKKEIGNPGMSAVDCVTAAVNEVLQHEPVDAKRVGLLGHSFGGYQTNFIITQTNMFAAAISGAGIADIISNYLYVSPSTSRSNGWRYEFNQSSIGVSLFDNYDAYFRNSPITFARQIQTPLLLWAGDEDKTVHFHQSVEMYSALRRMQKSCTMLVYEDASHSLVKKEYQRDLTSRMHQWFDYYLKSDSKPDWVNANQF